MSIFLQPNRQSPIANRQSGFTLIELLVVVAIIGLLLSIISITLTQQRAKARDTRRVSDMRQIKTGLDLYYAHGSGYPDATVWNASIGGILSCSNVEIMRVPADPSITVYSYTFTNPAAATSSSGCGGTVRGAYELEFFNEKQGRYYIMDEEGQVRDKLTGNPVSFESLL